MSCHNKLVTNHVSSIVLLNYCGYQVILDLCAWLSGPSNTYRYRWKKNRKINRLALKSLSTRGNMEVKSRRLERISHWSAEVGRKLIRCLRQVGVGNLSDVWGKLGSQDIHLGLMVVQIVESGGQSPWEERVSYVMKSREKRESPVCNV